MKKSNLDDILEILRNCGEQLVPYNFPKASPLYEDFIFPLKMLNVEVDGYDVSLHYSKSDWQDHFLESLQINGTNTPFLPFNVVAKIAQKALGGHHLSLVQTPRDNRMYYCWAVCTDNRGRPISFKHPAKATPCSYEGWEFDVLTQDSVNFH